MILKRLSKIPIIGVLFVIINSYVWGGNFDADERFAPLFKWIKVLTPGIIISLILTWWILDPITGELLKGDNSLVKALDDFSKKPGQLSVSILPSVLGFGIGVYALIFTLSENLINGFHTVGTDKDGTTALAINADMAYPLLIILSTTICGIIQQRFPESGRWILLNWFLLWYSLVLTLSLISSLFRLGEVSIVDKIEPPDQNKSST